MDDSGNSEYQYKMLSVRGKGRIQNVINIKCYQCDVRGRVKIVYVFVFYVLKGGSEREGEDTKCYQYDM